MSVTAAERKYLRDLARRYLDLSRSPVKVIHNDVIFLKCRRDFGSRKDFRIVETQWGLA